MDLVPRMWESVGFGSSGIVMGESNWKEKRCGLQSSLALLRYSQQIRSQFG